MNDISGVQMLIALGIGLIVLILLILKTKIHVFVALIISACIIGLGGGMKANDVVNAITGGFGGTLGNIGIIIGMGVMMGRLFEISGAAERMALTFLRIFGKKREEAALALTGFIVSIPIFCDSGFVILSPLAKAISRQTKKSIVGLSIALAAGLVITHSFVPPTPGPLARYCSIADDRLHDVWEISWEQNISAAGRRWRMDTACPGRNTYRSYGASDNRASAAFCAHCFCTVNDSDRFDFIEYGTHSFP